MGEVWRAEHRLLARQAAIKLMRAEALTDPQSAPKVRERFRREAQTLASMRSRHTIALHDYGVTDDGTFFYVMELLDGMDLDSLVRYHGPQPAARVIELLVQACQSLAEAHGAGLLHRDIKPANLFISRAAEEVDILKVLDFGIVRSMNESDALDPVEMPPAPIASGTGERRPGFMPPPGARLTQVGAVVGTPGYIPPEQAYGLPIDGRSDLYALGCVAWWLLTMSEVYPRPDEDTALQSHLNDPVPDLRSRVNGWLPDALEALVIGCLQKHPKDRPAGAAALAAALRVIEIPEEHAWTEQRAQAWWFVHRPIEVDEVAPAAAVESRLLVPLHSAEPPPSQSPAAAAATVVETHKHSS
jgi:serine/threonine-protein kinase